MSTSCFFCFCCGYVSNAFALPKRSGISAAFAVASILSMPARHTAIGTRPHAQQSGSAGSITFLPPNRSSKFKLRQ
jgi:hypothetical protein